MTKAILGRKSVFYIMQKKNCYNKKKIKITKSLIIKKNMKIIKYYKKWVVLANFLYFIKKNYASILCVVYLRNYYFLLKIKYVYKHQKTKQKLYANICIEFFMV